MNTSKVLVSTWLAAIGVISYRSFHNGTGMPAPRSLIAANVVYTLLGVLSLASVELANVLAIGSFVGLMVTDSTILGAAAKSVGSTTTTPQPSQTTASTTTPQGTTP